MLHGMRDWDQFVNQVSWFVSTSDTPEVGSEQPWQRGGVAGLPELSSLLVGATVTPVHIGDQAYELLAWGSLNVRRGWLALPPVATASSAIHVSQQRFWMVCGGIVERFGEPASWWLNQNEVLTMHAAQTHLAPVLDDYLWLWSNDGLEIPIQPSDFYVAAIEANGNLTVAHRATGQLLVFAPDHAYEGVSPLAGCPPYSLLTIDDIPDLPTWIERCARDWKDH